MGNEQSSPIDPDTPPSTLKDRTLAAVADLVKDGGVKDIVVLTGAGISTAAGIPDFRSPKTGLYHNLQRLKLPHAEDVFDIEFFRENPYPFYMLAKELYPGKFHPTVSHAFVALLAKKGLLRMLFTQNIDCLERRAGVPADKIVEAHGSFATQRCVDCQAEFPDGAMREHVERGEPPRCRQAGCGGLVKPDIVFFGEQLPRVFYDRHREPAHADLVLVLGTSLTVQPFASLPQVAVAGVPRVLFNKERVGDLGHRADDVLCLGDCDSGVRRLADALGWTAELEALWRGTVGDDEAERQIARLRRSQAEAEDEVDRLVQGVEDKLEISGHPADDGDANAAQVGAGAGAQEPAAAARHPAGEDAAAPPGPEAAGRPEDGPQGAAPGAEGTYREGDRPERVAHAGTDLGSRAEPRRPEVSGDREQPTEDDVPTS